MAAIETAKKLGYYTALCDYLTDNPGQYAAEQFYLVSTTDKEAVLEVARKEQIQGVLAYASDPAAPTAAYVAEKMGLPGNPYESVEILCNKDRFRNFLAANGFVAPQAKGYASAEEAIRDKDSFDYPVIIKPVDSSGSKGATVLHTEEGLREALEFAFSYSRSHRIIIEHYIEKKHPYLIGGDIFIENGQIVLWGLLNCHRDAAVNPLVPIGKSYPLQLGAADIQNVKDTLTSMVEKLRIRNGSMNVELVVDQQDRVWPIDVGPRSGGNMIPDLLGDMFGVDIAEMSVEAAMGRKVHADIHEPDGFYATHNLHSSRNGIYQGVWFSPEMEPYIYRKCLYKKPGDSVEYFDNASKCLGIIFMKFPSQAVMKDILNRINMLIRIRLKTDLQIQRVTGKEKIAKVILTCDDAFPNPVTQRAIYPELLAKISEKGNVIYAYNEERCGFQKEAMGYCAFYANDAEHGNAYISLLAVRPEYQHMQIGARLLQAACERMQLSGMKYCLLEVRKSNEAAQRFYEKIGFEKIEERGDKYLMKCGLESRNEEFAWGGSTPLKEQLRRNMIVNTAWRRLADKDRHYSAKMDRYIMHCA